MQRRHSSDDSGKHKFCAETSCAGVLLWRSGAIPIGYDLTRLLWAREATVGCIPVGCDLIGLVRKKL